MKFIFPQNYNFKNKFLGIFDYSTILFNILWCIFFFFILNIFIKNINFKIFIFILLCFPVIILSISGFNGESFIYVLTYLLKFIFKQKLYLFNKSP